MEKIRPVLVGMLLLPAMFVMHISIEIWERVKPVSARMCYLQVMLAKQNF